MAFRFVAFACLNAANRDVLRLKTENLLTTGCCEVFSVVILLLFFLVLLSTFTQNIFSCYFTLVKIVWPNATILRKCE